MATILSGSQGDMDAFLYGVNQNPATLQYLQNQLVPEFSAAVTGVAKSFFDNGQRIYEMMHGSEAMRLAKAALRKVSNVFQHDDVHELFNIGQLQQAKLVMQRWIMANPMARQMYHQQRIDGYSDTYHDVEPNTVGRFHYDYRRVMTGIVQEDPNDPDEWVCTTYVDDLKDGDKPLTLEEKVAVCNSWDLVEAFLERREEDPTSVWNNKM